MRRILFLSVIAVASLLLFMGCEKENQGDDKTGAKIETLSAEEGPLFVVLLTGRVSGLEDVALDFECGIEYSTDASFAEDKTIRQKADKKYSEDPYTVAITNVASGQKYYYRAYYISQLMIYYGEVKVFIFANAPQVTTLSAELNDSGVIVCKGIIDGLEDIIGFYGLGNTNSNLELEYGIQYSTSEGFEASATQTAYVDSQSGDTIVCSIYDFIYDT